MSGVVVRRWRVVWGRNMVYGVLAYCRRRLAVRGLLLSVAQSQPGRLRCMHTGDEAFIVIVSCPSETTGSWCSRDGRYIESCGQDQPMGCSRLLHVKLGMRRNNVLPSISCWWAKRLSRCIVGRHRNTAFCLPQACPATCIQSADISSTARPGMSLDPSANLQIFSPTGSGRSSPSPRATRNNTEEGMSAETHTYVPCMADWSFRSSF